MADSVYVEQNSTAVDDYHEPIIHTVTFTSDGDLTMVETSSSPGKVEIVQHANASEKHSTFIYPEMESATSSNGVTKVGELTTIRIDTQPVNSSMLSDQDPNFSVDTKTEGVPRLLLKGREIITVPDIYLAVRKIWKATGSLQRLMPKLGIQVMRFSPQELTVMKQQGAIGLTVKCCSYILRSDFERIAEKFDHTHGTQHRENILFLPLVDLDNPDYKVSIPGKAQSPASAKGNCHESSTGFRMLTILLSSGQTVIFTYELQGVFEAHFQNSDILYHCLFNLGIHQGNFTDYQLQELRASFVSGSDGAKLDFSRSYIMVDDAEKVVDYATSLLNTSKPEIKWMGPQKVLNGTEDGREAVTVLSDSTEEGESLQEGQHPPVGLSHSGGGNAGVIMKSSGSEREDGSPEGCPISSARIQNKGCPSSCTSRITNGQEIVGASRYLKASGVDGETSSTSTSSGHSVLRHFARHFNCSVQPKVPDSQPYLSTNTSGDCSTQSEVVVRTFLVDGQVVVCIPDVHRVVIHLFSQSVQVGYYMQRLQITPHRFSCVQLKHLKAYDVLSGKATVCTYITKPDAERLLHMFDLSYTESRLHEIHWAEPIVLDDVLASIQYKCKEAVHEDKVSPEKEGNPQSPATIPTFEIDGEVFVSVPDAHRAVQAVNGQSVQLRYNLDKLGIQKYKFSYSQVYQMKACTTLKRPSMCTFIAKSDAERLVRFYASHGNESRLALVEWLPSVKVGSDKESSQVIRSDAMVCGIQPAAHLRDANEITASGSDCHSAYPESRTCDPLACSSRTSRPQLPSPGCQTADASQGNLDTSSVLPDGYLSPEAHSRAEIARVSEAPAPSTYYCSSSCYTPGNVQRTVASLCMCAPHGGHHLLGVQMQCPSHATASSSFVDSYSSSPDGSTPGASVHSGQNAACVSTDQDGCIVGEKRAHSEEEDWHAAEVKKLRDDNVELIKTIQRKETEFKLLHDAYQQRIESERERRNNVEQELEERKRSCQCFSETTETRLDK